MALQELYFSYKIACLLLQEWKSACNKDSTDVIRSVLTGRSAEMYWCTNAIHCQWRQPCPWHTLSSMYLSSMYHNSAPLPIPLSHNEDHLHATTNICLIWCLSFFSMVQIKAKKVQKTDHLFFSTFQDVQWLAVAKPEEEVMLPTGMVRDCFIYYDLRHHRHLLHNSHNLFLTGDETGHTTPVFVPPCRGT